MSCTGIAIFRLLATIMEKRQESLSEINLGNKAGEKSGNERSDAVSDMSALVGSELSRQPDVPTWTLAERAKMIKVMLDLETNSHQGNSLRMDQIDLILSKFIELELLKPVEQRLTLREVSAIFSTVLTNKYTGDRYQMIVEAIQTLENDPNLKKSMENDMEISAEIYKDVEEPYEPVILEAKCEDVLELEINRVSKPDFIGHYSNIFSVAVSPDGKFIVSGSEDKFLRVWSVPDRKEECQLKGHSGTVFSLVISADSRYIVSGSEDMKIILWNFQERKQEWAFTGHTNYVSAVAVSADCNFIVSGSWDNTIKL